MTGPIRAPRPRGRRAVAAQVEPYARAWEERNAEARNRAGHLWVVLGDSLSQGIGASDPQDGWVPVAARELDHLGRPYRVLNLSRTGATTHDVLERQLPLLRGLGAGPALVTLLVGANDMLRRRNRAGLVARWAALLDQLPGQSVVGLMPQPVPVAWRVNELIQARAEETGLTPVEVRRAVWPFVGHRAADYFHPNDRGYARIAEVFVEAILTRAYP